MRTKVNYGKCQLIVSGMDMNCPLCGTLVKSGQQHACENPAPPKCFCLNGRHGRITPTQKLNACPIHGYISRTGRHVLPRGGAK